MPTTQEPSSRPMKVVRLERPSADDAPKPGRPRKLKFPPIPQEILDGMTELEQAHYRYFVESHQQQYPDLTPTDQIGLHMAALDYVSLLRMNATQMASGQLVTMSRQHPGVQLRAWMDSLSVTRKQRGPAKEKDEAAEMLKALSS
jgi:hypothetical protein